MIRYITIVLTTIEIKLVKMINRLVKWVNWNYKWKLNLTDITRLELENKVKYIYIDKDKNVKIDFK